MGCAASHEEPPRQQLSQQKPTAKQAAKDHPSYPQQQNNQQENTGLAQKNDQQPDARKPNPTAVTKESLQQYIALEKELHRLEGKNILKARAAKEEAVKEQETYVATVHDQYNKSVEETMKEKSGLTNDASWPSLEGILADEEALAKETPEFVEALNRQEIAKKEYSDAQRQLDLLAADLEKIKKEAEKVDELYAEQDELLAGIFGGSYGSELENKLESDLDMLLERKQRIGIAKYKWKSGRVLLQYACTQLACAVRKWMELRNYPRENARERYVLATETRNNVVAANQNLVSAQRYLNNIIFPYCKPAELETLQRASNNIYTDMQTPDRTEHALNVYNVTYKRAAALLQWFDHVLNGTIVKDATNANLDAATKEKDLRSERLRLIKEKVREVLGDGEEVDLDIEEDMNLGSDEEEEELMPLAARTEASEGGTSEAPSGDNPETAPAPTPLPLEELAPAPSNDDLFGNINELKRQHEKDMEELDKAQELNKARVEQGLQEKLRARRSHRRRTATQEAEVKVHD